MLFVALMSVYTKGKKLGKYTHFFQSYANIG